LDSIRFKIDSNTDYSVLFLDYYQINNEAFLLNLNRRNNSIQVFDYKSRTLLKTINLKNKIQGFYVHNLDSIFCLGQYDNVLTLTDTSGKVKNEWQLDPLLTEINHYEAFILNSHRMFYIDSKIFLTIGANLKFPAVYNTPTKAVFELNKDSVKLLRKIVKFSSKNWGKEEYLSFYPTITIDKKKNIIISHDIEHDLHVISSNGVERNHPCKSNYINEFLSFDLAKWTNRTYNNKFQIERPSYADIIFDKFRNIYYRIARHGIKEINPDGSRNDVFDMPWSIIVLDSNFVPFKEIFCPARKFRCTDLIVTKDGLLISNNHESNPNFNPNYLSFTILNVEYEKH